MCDTVIYDNIYFVIVPVSGTEFSDESDKVTSGKQQGNLRMGAGCQGNQPCD